MRCEGNGASLELADGTLTIRRKGLLSFMSHGLKGEKRIPLSSISAVQFKEPGITTGYLQLTVVGGRESQGGVMAATNDENTVLFGKKGADAFREMRAAIEAAIANRGASTTTSATSMVDQLERLANLRDRGMLSEDEFTAQKNALLHIDGAAPVIKPPATTPEVSPAKPARKRLLGGCLGIILLLFVVGSITRIIGGGDTASNKVDSTAPISKERTEYLQRLRREAKALAEPDKFDPGAWKSKDAIMIQLAVLGAQAKIYAEGADHNLSDAEEAERDTYKAALSERQQIRFPALRSNLTEVVREAMKDNRFQVQSEGTRQENIAITGPLLDREEIADVLMRTIGDTPEMLRVKEIGFGTPDTPNTISRSIDSIGDDVVATLTNEGWSPVD